MRTKISIALVCGLASVLSVGRAADPSPEPPPDITCRLDNGTGTLTATGGPRGTLVRIANPGFEGNATITFNGGTPPARLTFTFANLRMMRGFTLSDGKRTFQGQLALGGQSPFYWDKSGRTVSNPILAAVTMVMETTKAGDVAVRLTTSPDVELGKELKVNWIQPKIYLSR